MKSCGSGRTVHRLLWVGVHLRPAEVGFLYLSEDKGVNAWNALTCCFCCSGPHLFHLTGSTRNLFTARSEAELAKSPQCPFLFNVVLVYPCIKDLGDCTDLFRDIFFLYLLFLEFVFKLKTICSNSTFSAKCLPCRNN